MKFFPLMSVALLPMLFAPARAAVIYSSLKDIVIPTDFVGMYLDIDTGTTGIDDSSPPAGWDINPFFGGMDVANSPAFQPARTGTGTTDAIFRLSVGATIDVARVFSTGFGGSQTHLNTQFLPGQEGYLGFKFTTNAPITAGPYYGWMRVIFTANTTGATIKDWAFENTGSPIVSGRVQQGTAIGGTQFVTLSPASGESFTLGSALTDTGGNTNRLLKVGLGTTIFVSANTYSGGTIVGGGVLRVNADNALGAATGGITIDTGATLQAGGAITSNRAFTLGTGGGKIDTNGNTVTLGAGSAVSGSTLTKIGSGTLTISGTQNYAVLSANAGTTIVNTTLGTGSSTVNASANVTFGASQRLTALTIGAGAVVTLTNAAPAPDFLDGIEEIMGGVAPASSVSSSQEAAIDADFASNQVPSVPEPGRMSLLFLGVFGLFWRRYRVEN